MSDPCLWVNSTFIVIIKYGVPEAQGVCFHGLGRDLSVSFMQAPGGLALMAQAMPEDPVQEAPSHLSWCKHQLGCRALADCLTCPGPVMLFTRVRVG